LAALIERQQTAAYDFFIGNRTKYNRECSAQTVGQPMKANERKFITNQREKS
jgi:hypothetical protein